MKKYIFSILLPTILGAMACQKEEVNIKPDEYLVFGYIGIGWKCKVLAIHMIADGKLYTDTSNVYCKDQEKYSFSGYQLSDNEYNKVKNLVAQFPAELLKEGTKTFGCPGCADGGMLYIQRKEKGKDVQTWRIDDSIFYRDTDVNNDKFPAYLLLYGRALGKGMAEIKYR